MTGEAHNGYEGEGAAANRTRGGSGCGGTGRLLEKESGGDAEWQPGVAAPWRSRVTRGGGVLRQHPR
jgi:hypothetical protein